MSKREFTVVVEEAEDGFLIGSVPELRGCHTQGRSLDELMQRLQEVITLCLEDDEEEADAEPRMRFVGVHRIAV